MLYLSKLNGIGAFCAAFADPLTLAIPTHECPEQALCSLLGTKPKDMRGRDMASLLPQPFGLLHHRWIKDAEGALTKPPPSSCRAGAVHSLLSANGVHVPVRMAISSRDMAGVSM